MKPSLKNKLFWFLKNSRNWVNIGELERYATTLGYTGSTASRHLREMVAANGRIKGEEKANPNTGLKTMWYKYEEGIQIDEATRTVRITEPLQAKMF